jgi:hypothetical protein
LKAVSWGQRAQRQHLAVSLGASVQQQRQHLAVSLGASVQQAEQQCPARPDPVPGLGGDQRLVPDDRQAQPAAGYR